MHVLAALEGRAQDRVVEELPRLDRLVHTHEVLEEDATRADGEVPHFGVAHLARRQPHRPPASPEAFSVVCGYSAQRRSKTGVRASEIAFPGPGGAHPQPSRMTRTTRGYVLLPRISRRRTRSRARRRRRALPRRRTVRAAREHCRACTSRRTGPGRPRATG